MSAFLIFDPRDDLIFSKCDKIFKRILSEIVDYGNKIESNEIIDGNETEEIEEERLSNWLSIYLTPYHNEYLFISLKHQNDLIDDDYHNDSSERIFHQLEVNMFCHTSVFLFGEAFNLISKELSLQKFLFILIENWNSSKTLMPFILLSIEKLYVGFHIAKLCEDLSRRIELLLKLEIRTFLKEIFAFCFILYNDSLIHQYQSNQDVRLQPKDLALILLMSKTVQSEPKEQNGPIHSNESLRQSLIISQHLVFLQSSQKIPVPHIFRKISIDENLSIICISEISSMLLISIPMLLHSASEYRIKSQAKCSINIPPEWEDKRTIDNLIKCIRSMDAFIAKNLESFSQRNTFNLSSLENLNYYSKKASSRRNSEQNSINQYQHPFPQQQTDRLMREQNDRIFSLLNSSLYRSYERIFRQFLTTIDDENRKQFDALVETIQNFDHLEHLRNCVNFIRMKYENINVSLLDNLQALKVYQNLLAFIMVDRETNNFFKEIRSTIRTGIDRLFYDFLVKIYRKKFFTSEKNKRLIFWYNDRFLFVYVGWSNKDSLKNLSEADGIEIFDDDVNNVNCIDDDFSDWIFDDSIQNIITTKEFFGIMVNPTLEIQNGFNSLTIVLRNIIKKIQWYLGGIQS
ncbi:Actin-interacting protein 1 [Sarcoptes scabiei]|nr:Actin-interacting protein 1 [Sarcoptes scabiei]